MILIVSVIHFTQSEHCVLLPVLDTNIRLRAARNRNHCTALDFDGWMDGALMQHSKERKTTVTIDVPKGFVTINLESRQLPIQQLFVKTVIH